MTVRISFGWAAIAIALGCARTASADPPLADPAVRCELGAAEVARGDLSRASIDIAGCDDPLVPAPLRQRVARATAELARRLRASDLAVLSVESEPSGVIATLDDLPGTRFVTPATIWVKPGKHIVRATIEGAATITTTTTIARDRTLVLLTGPRRASTAPKDRAVDFTQESIDDTQDAPPPDVKHPPLTPPRFQPQQPNGAEQIPDPLAVAAPAPDGPRRYHLGVRVGGGAFGDGDAGTHAGVSIAAVGSWAPSPTARAMLAIRGEWTRADALDTFGLAVGPAFAIARAAPCDLRIGVALRGELRDGMDVRTAGLGADAALELALHGAPIVFGLRGRQGITELAPGVHDHAVLAEVGVDW